MPRILIVEDDPDISKYLHRTLETIGYEVVGVESNATGAIQTAASGSPDIVILDIGISGEPDGIGAAEIIREEFRVPVVFLTGRSDPETISRASLARPCGYLIKPVQREQLSATLEVALRSFALDLESERSEPALLDLGPGVIVDSARPPVGATRTLRPTSRGKIIGRHPLLLEALSTIERIRMSDCNVLITGESGTGKELIVAALHDAGPRSKAPLVAVNCGAISHELIESELFGHARGAFTGAQQARTGLVAAAEGGTLFLDEIGDMPLGMQVKLLRLIQQREYLPVGSSKPSRANVRIVAATNKNLEDEVAANRFREDLFYRLNVIHIHLPPLRERGQDIPLLVQHFFDAACQRAGRTDLRGISSAAMQALVEHAWPGNIRALENVLERAVLLATGPEVQPVDLPPKIRGDAATAMAPTEGSETHEPTLEVKDLRAAVEQYENNLIRNALVRAGNNKNRAAQMLGVNRTTLVEIIKRRGIGAETPR